MTESELDLTIVGPIRGVTRWYCQRVLPQTLGDAGCLESTLSMPDFAAADVEFMEWHFDRCLDSVVLIDSVRRIISPVSSASR